MGPVKSSLRSFKEKIRSHLDIEKERDNTRHLKAATKFYTDCAMRA